MTVTSWRAVPSGVASHHHCLATVEWSNEPHRWTDAATTPPHLVAWNASEVLPWIHQQLTHYRGEAAESHGRLDELDAALADYQSSDLAPPTVGTYPTLWQRLAVSLSRGGWEMPTWHLSNGRKLVLQILVYANHNQPAGHYPTCRFHQQPPGEHHDH